MIYQSDVVHNYALTLLLTRLETSYGKKGQICSCRRFPHCILTPHIAETFVVTVGNSELNYSIIPAHLFVGFFYYTIEYIIK